MMNYVLSKENTNAKIKAAAKADLSALLIEFFKEKCGDENVKWIRTGGLSKTNEIGIRIGTVEINGEENDLVATLNPTIKEFEDRKTAKKEYFAFDFEAAAQEYEDYLAEKADKTAAAKKAKEAKKEKDAAERKKKKEEEDCSDFD